MLNGLFEVVRAGGGMGIPGIYTAGDPEAKTESRQTRHLQPRLRQGVDQVAVADRGQAPVMKYSRDLMMAILWDRMPYLSEVMNIEVVPLEKAPRRTKRSTTARRRSSSSIRTAAEVTPVHLERGEREGRLSRWKQFRSKGDGNMAHENLEGLKVAILVDDGFEQVEIIEPRKALDQAGTETRIVSPKGERVRGWDFTDWGDELPVDVPFDRAQPDDFDALLLPGGVFNPDALRMQPKAVEFVKAFFDAGKPVASICHGPWTIIEAGAARGGGSPRGRPSRLISVTPARSGWIRRSWSMATSWRAASPTTSRRSTGP